MAKKKVMTVEEFEALPIAKQRVLVAKDVIAQIQAKRYSACTGAYVYDIEFKNDVCTKKQDVKDNFNNIEKCEVCALGGLVMSLTKYKNKLTFGDIEKLGSNKKATKLLTSVFIPEQLVMIESAFEEDNSAGYWSSRILGTKKLDKMNTEKYEQWASDKEIGYYQHDERLVAIMQNLIDNKGEFVI